MRYDDILVRLSTDKNEVGITRKMWGNEKYFITNISYDKRNGYYYFIELENIMGRVIEKRVIVKNKKDFHAYFDEVVEKSFEWVIE